MDHGSDPEKFREDLMNIARTTLSSKILSQHKDFFAKMAVDAVLRLKKSGNLDAIQIIRVPGGLLEDSFLDEGNWLGCIEVWDIYEGFGFLRNNYI